MLAALDSGLRLGVLGIDPGGTSGWAAGSFLLGDLPRIRRVDGEVFRLTSGEFDGSENGQMRKIERWVNGAMQQKADGVVDHIVLVVESFSLRVFRRDTDLLAPVRMIAKIDYANSRLGWNLPIVYQTPSHGKQFKDPMLRNWNAWVVGKEHARDANRHVIQFMRGCRKNPKRLATLLAER